MDTFYISFDSLVPWQRARTNKGRYYDPQLTVKHDLAALFIAQANKLNTNIFDEKLTAVCVFFKKKPKNHRKNQKIVDFCNKKPDIDNLEKFLFDITERQAKLIKNDAQIVLKMSLKLWGEHDRTIFILGKHNGNFIFDSNKLDVNGVSYDVCAGSFVIKQN